MVFQSTPPRGGRPWPAPPRRQPRARFNPRPRAGGDCASPALPALTPRFNPRPRAGGDIMRGAKTKPTVLFQSTPPRVGRRRDLGTHRTNAGVSIHAPARGATQVPRLLQRPRPVSIHAPARGATPRRSTAVPRGGCFNPRPRAGGDGASPAGLHHPRRFNPRPRAGVDGDRPRRHPALAVSIHAPARGATSRAFVSAASLVFQSTPPRGGRHQPLPGDGAARQSFNPRPRAGGDTRSRCGTQRSSTFQSTPPRGGRRRVGDTIPLEFVFQSTPPRGGRPRVRDGIPRQRQVSIHAPTRGATARGLTTIATW